MAQQNQISNQRNDNNDKESERLTQELAEMKDSHNEKMEFLELVKSEKNKLLIDLENLTNKNQLLLEEKANSVLTDLLSIQN